MAKFQIKSADGQTVRYEGKPKYSGVFGKPSCLEFAKIASPVQIDFEVGDYIDYARTGFRYYLYSLPQPTKQSSNNTSGEGYVYKNVQFFCKTQDLEIAPFRDIILNSSGNHFTTLSNVSTYEDVYGIADRIQACLNDFCGNGVWSVQIYEGDADIVAKMHEVQSFTISDGSVLDALNQIYTQWMGIGWIYSCPNGQHTITIGRPNVQDSDNTTDVFYYGKGHGLKVLAKAVSSKNDLATRIFVYGSDRNLPTRWYNNQGIYDANQVYIPNLMIPLSAWGKTDNLPDPRKAYLENQSMIDTLGLRVKTVRFDGTGEYEEIYPSIEGQTFADVRAGDPDYMPSAQYLNSDRVDELKAVTNPTDNGIVNTNGSRYKETHDLSLTQSGSAVTIGAGQKSVVISMSLADVAAIVNAGMLELDLSDVKFIVPAVGGYVSSVKSHLVVKINDDEVFRRVLSVSVGTDIISECGKYRINIDNGGDLSLEFIFEAELHDISLAFAVVPRTELSDKATANIANFVPSDFTVTLKQIGFDISKQYTTDSDGYGTIEMKTGACAGRSFVIRRCTYQAATDDWLLSLQREEDSSLGQVFPNTQYLLSAGDRFVITGIMMPDLYIQASANRLLSLGQQALRFLSKPKMVYTPEIDSKVIAESGETLTEGMYMRVYDSDIVEDGTVFVLIDSLTIDEGADAIPIYNVTLRDTKASSIIEKITGEEAANSLRLRNLENSGDRNPYDGGFDEGDEVVPPAITILCDSPFFTYGEDKSAPLEDHITLTCDVQNLQAVTFRWQYWDESTDAWVNITGANKQTYDVLPDGAYFPEGDLSARIRCVVNNVEDYNAEITIVHLTGGLDGLTVMLSTPSLVFAADETHAIADTASVDVIAYRGATRFVTNVGTITGGISGKISAVKVNDGTTETSITVTITDTCDVKSGAFTIPVTVDGSLFSLRLGWSLAMKGGKGDPGTPGGDGDPGEDGYNTATVFLYKRAATASIDWTGDLVYIFDEKRLDTVPTGWSTSVPAKSGKLPLWVTAATALSRTNRDAIGKNEWATPQIMAEDGQDGAHGINAATIFLFERGASAPSKPSSRLTYTFATGDLSGTLGGWSRNIPATDGTPCWVIQATALGAGATDYIESSEWSNPLKLVEDGSQGLKGAAIRGPVEWVKGRRYCSGVRGSDAGATDEDEQFIDIVYVQSYDPSEGRTSILSFLCKKSYTADSSSLLPSLDTEHWTPADEKYQFIATNVLLADSGKIKFLSSNQILLMDGNTIVGGGQGGTDIIWWAGADVVTTPINAAPFRVSYQGEVWMTAAHIEKGCTIGQFDVNTYTDAGVTYTGLKNTNGKAFIDMDNGAGTKFFRVGTNPNGPEVQVRSDSGTAVSILAQNAGSTGISILAQAGAKGITINNEDVVLSESIAHIWKGTQAQYDAITTKDNATLYIIV